MNKYKIEHKILTLAKCAVLKDKENPATFEVDGVEFTHWDFSWRDGWPADAWIAKTKIEATNFVDAINVLGKKLSKIIPRISLISQSYIEYIFEPFIVHKEESELAFVRYAADVQGGGLMFMENDEEALGELMTNSTIPDPFYYYWNDATNAMGYSAKLLLMFSAIEAFAKKRDKNAFKKPLDLYTDIFGDEIANEIFKDGDGLRNRLVHGEYFKDEDHKKNYLDVIHNKIVNYFNTKILSKPAISENIVHPQRHPFGNKTYGNFAIKNKDGSLDFNLKDVINNFSDGRFITTDRYEIVYDANFNSTY